MLIRAEDISKAYGNHIALEALTFEAQQGCVVGILGSNGAGKSTTMKILSGILAPDTGRVLLDGISLADKPCQAKKLIGYLPETPPLYQDLRVDEYLRFCARLRGISGRSCQTQVAQAIARCNLQSVARRLIGQLSKGYQQRVGIAQAILHQPKLLILDEPTVGLDPTQLIEIRQLIQEIGKHCTVILSTHILAEVESCCSRVLILNSGKKLFDGPMEVFNPTQATNWVFRFLSAPSLADISELFTAYSVSSLGPETFCVHSVSSEQQAVKLLNLCVAQGWSLVETYQQKQTLEDKFVALTCQHAPSQSLEAAQ